jgi:hypothetical protein
MDRLRIAGFALALGGLAGYAVGVAVAYPGRSFSITALLVGVTMLVVGSPRTGGGSS